MDSDFDDSFSPFSLRKQRNALAFQSPHSSKKGVAVKLSLRKNSKQADDDDSCPDPTKTPVNSAAKPVSAAFLFSSCKKKSPISRRPGKEITVLVDSSDDGSLFEQGIESEQEDDVVQESLEEYSLIRRWLQNADSYDSDSDQSTKSPGERSSPEPIKTPDSPLITCETIYQSDDEFPDSPIISCGKINVNKEALPDSSMTSRVKVITNQNEPKKTKEKEVIVLSSDDEEQFEKFLQSVKKETVLPRRQSVQSQKNSSGSNFINDSSVIEDSFDSSFVLKSLRERLNEIDNNLSPFLSRPEVSSEKILGTRPKCQSKLRDGSPSGSSSSVEGDERPQSKDGKAAKPARTAPNRFILCDSDSNSDSDTVLIRRRKPKTIQTPGRRKPLPKPTFGSDSELEDIFTGLSLDVRPKDLPTDVKGTPKAGVKSKPKSTVSTRHPSDSRQQRSFLHSLSANVPNEQRHPDAAPYVKSFRKLRDDLTGRLFLLFNQTVFDNQLPRDFSVTWNSRLTRTAGYCRHFTRRENGNITFESRIELSVKVVDTPCRLRDTLIHEMCHAATWMIDNCRGGHGPVWRKWANLSQRIYPELPPITRCHNYEISYKFYYNCTGCSYSIGRHSKSVDTATQVCPRCRGRLQLGKEPHSKENQAPAATPQRTPRAPNAFALFVKEHYANVRSSRPDLPHASIMKYLSTKFAESKK